MASLFILVSVHVRISARKKFLFCLAGERRAERVAEDAGTAIRSPDVGRAVGVRSAGPCESEEN